MEVQMRLGQASKIAGRAHGVSIARRRYSREHRGRGEAKPGHFRVMKRLAAITIVAVR
jgi:hypothetical protein